MQPNFSCPFKVDKYDITTRTLVGHTNMIINLDMLFPHIAISNDKDAGVIAYKKYKRNHAGCRIRTKETKAFQSSINLDVYVPNPLKHVNVKISKSKFQITGCKHADHAIYVAKIMLNMIFTRCPESIKITQSPIGIFNGETLPMVLFLHQMTNFKLTCPMFIDREKLDEVVYQTTDWLSFLEQSVGYSGVNIKLPYTITEPEELQMDIPCIQYNQSTSSIRVDHYTFAEYFKSLNPAYRQLTIQWFKKKRVTFLVFNSGSVIVSGLNEEMMNSICGIFFEFLSKHFYAP